MVQSSNISKRIGQLNRVLRSVPTEAHKEFVKVTPKKTGNAKRSTKLKDTTIAAEYNYANRLNTGWSKQAPQGMFKPMVDHMRSWVARELRRL